MIDKNASRLARIKKVPVLAIRVYGRTSPGCFEGNNDRGGIFGVVCRANPNAEGTSIRKKGRVINAHW